MQEALSVELADDTRAAVAQEIDFQGIYRRHWRELCCYLARKFGSASAEAEDVVQSAFVKVVELCKSQVILNPRALLYRTAINLMIDQKRHQQCHNRIIDDNAGPEIEELACAHHNPENVYLGKEELCILERVILGLPPRHRDYFLANRLEDLSYSEISRRTGASQSCVRKIVEEALAVCQDAVNGLQPDCRGLSRERGARR